MVYLAEVRRIGGLMEITGIHHIALVSGDAARTRRFYTGVLGLDRMEKADLFDQPTSDHLYFGDAAGTLIACMVQPAAPRGRTGIGGAHHLALTAETTNAQLKWKRWLIDQGVAVQGPYDRTYFRSIYFRDPDGQILEIATRWPGLSEDEPEAMLGATYIDPPPELTKGRRDEAAVAAQTWPEPITEIQPDMALAGLHHISAIGVDIARTAAFWTGVLGLRLVKQTGSYDDPSIPHYYFGVDTGEPGTLITYFGFRPDQMRRAAPGRGQAHHFALAVADADALAAWRDRLQAAGVPVTPVQTGPYFRSISFRDPDGILLELATREPGDSER
jgi:glyoxalase family protein